MTKILISLIFLGFIFPFSSEKTKEPLIVEESTSGQEAFLSDTPAEERVWVPHMEEILDVDKDGINEKIITEYECNGTAKKPQECKYYLSIYSEDEIIFPKTWITNEENLSKREPHPAWQSKNEEYEGFINFIYTAKINEDDTPDLMIVWIFGLETGQTIAIDIKNKELIGCKEFFNFGYSQTVFGGNPEVIEFIDLDDDTNNHIITEEDFRECEDYWR